MTIVFDGSPIRFGFFHTENDMACRAYDKDRLVLDRHAEDGLRVGVSPCGRCKGRR